MKIVIIGAGKVGYSIIENFIDEENDIVIIDQDAERLEYISSRFDLLTINGSATDLAILERAGLSSTDLVCVVTNDDNVNLIVAKLAHELFNVTFKIVRLRSGTYLSHREQLFNIDGPFPIDYIIEPAMTMAESIYNLVSYPGCETFTHFGDKQIALFSCIAEYGGIFIGRSALSVFQELADEGISLVSIIRNGRKVIINEALIINAGDQIVICSHVDHIMLAISKFQRPLARPKRIMLAGGSKVNFYLAKMLENKARVKIIENNSEKVQTFSRELHNCLIIYGDCSDENLLYEEKIDQTDLIITATSEDNRNVMTSLLAKRLGAKRTITVMGRLANRNLMENPELDLVYIGKNDIATELRSHARLTIFKAIYKDINNTYQVAEYLVTPEFIRNHPVVNGKHSEKGLSHIGATKVLGVLRHGEYYPFSTVNELQAADRLMLLFNGNEEVKQFLKLSASPIDVV